MDEDAQNGKGAVRPGALTELLRKVAGAPESPELPDLALPPGTVIDRFEIVRELDRGGFGVVYEARDRKLDRKVAFKLVRPGKEAGADLLVREAETIARFSHPNLVHLYDVGQSEHGPYLVLELLRGRTLQARLDTGPVPVPEALRVAVEVARGLAHAHAHGVFHRDLKPENVFLCDDGAVKILDFGMAHAFGRKRVSGGTPAYMAPEQWAEDPEDERTDVFALGVMLHRMLSGEYPFPEDGGKWSSGPATAARLLVPDAPGLKDLVERMLAKAPKGRPRGGAEVLAALEEVEQKLRSLPSSASVRARAVKRKATLSDVVADLKRRRVFRVLIGYGIFCFAVLQVIEAIMHGLHWPEATLSYVVVGLAAGFPVVVALAWAFDVGPGGLVRTSRVASGLRGLRLAAVLGGLGLAAAAPGVGWFLLRPTGGQTVQEVRTSAPAASAGSRAKVAPQRWLVPIGAAPRIRGPVHAPVTVVEFADFQCPYTRLAEPQLRLLSEKYPDKLRIVWRDYPLSAHPDADAAAQLALEALRQRGAEGFWKAHDGLLALSPRVGRAALERLAKDLGLDAAEVRSALETERHRVAIDEDIQALARLGTGGTPTFFVNGRKLESEEPEALEQAVVEALAEARRLAASGVAPSRLYDELQRGARELGEPPARVTLPAPGRRPARGGPTGRAVAVNEFCDLSLVRCAWFEPMLRRTLGSYGDEVRLVWWDVSDLQRPESRRARRAALAAKATPNGFWSMHDAILSDIADGPLDAPPPERLALPALREHARRGGVDLAVFDYEMATDEGRPPEDPEVEEARALGLRPGSLVVGGEVVSGFDPPWVLRAAIDRALAHRP